MGFHNTIKKSLLWDITRRCNLNCIHCYNSGSIDSVQELEVESNYKTIINRAIEVGINHIHLLGGEPLLSRGLWDLLQYAKMCNVLISINTNGTLLTEDLIITKDFLGPGTFPLIKMQLFSTSTITTSRF